MGNDIDSTGPRRVPRIVLHDDEEYISIGFNDTNDTLLKIGGQSGGNGLGDKTRVREWVLAVERAFGQQCGELAKARDTDEREMCLVHTDRGAIATTAMCHECYERERRYHDRVRGLLTAAHRWLGETGPGMHTNTANGRGQVRRAVDRLEAALGLEEHDA